MTDLAHTTTRRGPARRVALEKMMGFLVDRLAEELAALWDREHGRLDGPDLGRLTAHAAILSEHLEALRDGRLPTPSQLGVLLIGYRVHPDFDPAWPEWFVRRPRRAS